MKAAARLHAPDMPAFNVLKVREDFPILKQKIYGKPLVYLDNAATSQKPQIVIDTLANYHSKINSNIHRGVHFLSERATYAYEDSRLKIRKFLHASDQNEIIFVRGTTEGINLVAQSYGRKNIGSGDEIILGESEHHSNIVPWQLLCEQTGARIRVIPLNDAGELQLDEYEKLLNKRTKFVSVGHVSNALGTVNPVEEIIRLAHQRNVPVLVDGAQAVPHLKVDVRSLDCDFYVFSGHKLFGPTGVGVLYGKLALLEMMPPYQGGGDMISSVTFEKTTYNKVPYKFEAGTPNIAGGIGLGASIDYLNSLGLDTIAPYENELLDYGIKVLSGIPDLRIIGTAKEKVGVISFVIKDVHPHDMGTVLDRDGIAIRAGHHCAMPVMKHFGVPATCRASFAFYNTKEEIDALAEGIKKGMEIFK